MTALWQRLKPLWDDEKRRVQLLAAVGMAGLLLLAVSEWLPAETAAEPLPAAETQDADYAAQLEQQMAELLGTVEGYPTAKKPSMPPTRNPAPTAAPPAHRCW